MVMGEENDDEVAAIAIAFGVACRLRHLLVLDVVIVAKKLRRSVVGVMGAQARVCVRGESVRRR